MDRLTEQASACIAEIKEKKNLTSDSAVAEHLGINSAFLYHLRKGNLRPTLYSALVDRGLLPPPAPTIELPVAGAALMFAVAKFPKVRPKKRVAKKRAPRISIQKERPVLAASAIMRNMSPLHVQQLIETLIEESSGEYDEK